MIQSDQKQHGDGVEVEDEPVLEVGVVVVMVVAVAVVEVTGVVLMGVEEVEGVEGHPQVLKCCTTVPLGPHSSQ